MNSPQQYWSLLRKGFEMAKVGAAPIFNKTKNYYGQQYSRNWLAHESKKVKALAKSHLFFHSLKPKMKQLQDYIQANPTAENVKEYTDILQIYFGRLDFITKKLKNTKESLVLNQYDINIANMLKQHHNEVTVPAGKLVLQEMNKEEERHEAQKKVYNQFKSYEIQLAEEAEMKRKQRLENAGMNYQPSISMINNNFKNLRREREEQYKQAVANERRKVQNYVNNVHHIRNFGSFTRKNTNRHGSKRTRKN